MFGEVLSDVGACVACLCFGCVGVFVGVGVVWSLMRCWCMN